MAELPVTWDTVMELLEETLEVFSIGGLAPSIEALLDIGTRIASDEGKIGPYKHDQESTTRALENAILIMDRVHETGHGAAKGFSASLTGNIPRQELQILYKEGGPVYRDLLALLKEWRMSSSFHAPWRRHASQKRVAARLKALRESWTTLLSAISSQESHIIEDFRAALPAGRLDEFAQAAIQALLDGQLLLEATQLVNTARRCDAAKVALSIPGNTAQGQAMVRANEFVHGLLQFEAMPNRASNIAEVSADWCGWLYGEHDDKSTKLSRWLEHDHGVYLIAGNEGSGKSTLMKYILSMPRTIDLLKNWSRSGTSSPVTAPYFFWRSGTQLQRSEEGLLRSLIYSVVKARPEFTPRVLPREWATSFESARRGIDKSVAPELTAWNLDNLRAAFKNLFNLQINILFLVDGLDEYQANGDSELACIDMIRNLTEGLVESQNVKVLASSRPLKDLERLQISPKVDLQKANYEAIRNHVCDTLTYDLDLLASETDDNVNGPKLIDYVLSTANGSFLWATLVVKIIRKQLSQGITLEKMYQERTTLLPAQMPQVYQRLFFNMNANRRKEASEILQIMLAGRSLSSSPSNSDEAMRLVDLALAIGDPMKAVDALILPWSVDRIQIKCRRVARGFTTAWPDFIKVNMQSDMISTHIEFCHRSVLDFLQLEETRRMLKSWSSRDSEPEFCPYISHLKSAVQHLKILPKQLERKHLRLLWVFAKSGLLAANRVKVGSRDSAIYPAYRLLLRELDRTMQYHHDTICKAPGLATHYRTQYLESRIQDVNGAVEWHDRGRDHERMAKMHWSNFHYDRECSHPRGWQDSFLSLAVQFGLNTYVDQVLQEGGWAQMLKKGTRPKRIKKGRPLLNYALAPSPIAPYSLITHTLVDVILRHGAKVGEKFEGRSCWENALRWQYETYVETGTNTPKGSHTEERDLAEQRAQIFRVLLQNGADTHAVINTPKSKNVSANDVVEKSFKNLAVNSTYEELQAFFREVPGANRI